MFSTPDSRAAVYTTTALIMLVGPVNFLLFRVMFDSFGAPYAFFVSQGVNFLYCVIGGVALYPLMWTWDGWRLVPDYGTIDKGMRALPQRKFMLMAAMDCAGTFLAAMGAVHTPGQYQTLLNQSLIPCTMAASVLFLRAPFSRNQYFGAATILAGAMIAISPSFMDSSAAPYSAPPGDGSSDVAAWVATCLYLASNIPMALSAVYKESKFQEDDVHPLYLTQAVSIYQFLFGFFLAPMQVFPGIASAGGMSLGEIWQSFAGGWACWLEGSPFATAIAAESACRGASAGAGLSWACFWLLPGYCVVNFVFNAMGLMLTASPFGGAALQSMSYSMLLPLTCLSNALPLLGPYKEMLQPPTLAGLVVVLAGFGLYESEALQEQLCGGAGGAERQARGVELVVGPTSGGGGGGNGVGGGNGAVAAAREDSGLLRASHTPTTPRSATPGRHKTTASYQERLVLVSIPIAVPGHHGTALALHAANASYSAVGFHPRAPGLMLGRSV